MIADHSIIPLMLILLILGAFLLIIYRFCLKNIDVDHGRRGGGGTV